ncbi:MAG: SDR family oxidoreductase [Streptosporangiales bacterium]|nr:SDR family oxidoreductase [Streptosporangiales bacterium]
MTHLSTGIDNCSETRKLEDGDYAWWTDMVSINLDAAYIWCKEASPHLADGASIVTISSVHAMVGPRLHSSAAYSASKAGVVGLTKALAVELASRHIRVNTVAPGLVESPLTRPRIDDKKYRAAWFARQPIQRMITAHDVAMAVQFLVSNEASAISGVVLPVDGGLLASS